VHGAPKHGRAISKAARVATMAVVMLGRWCGMQAEAGQSGASSEYAVKAAFLYHFAQFVEWPDAAFRDASSPLVYCTIGADPFDGTLETTLKGKTIGARAIEVRHAKQAGELQGCHLVFVGDGQKKQIPAVVAELHAAPVLIVGESEKFVEEGGTIGFVLEENKVRFEVNLGAAEKSGLRINAKLLALAKSVVGAPKRG
jgi:YfiR/HmsC-like